MSLPPIENHMVINTPDCGEAVCETCGRTLNDFEDRFCKECALESACMGCGEHNERYFKYDEHLCLACQQEVEDDMREQAKDREWTALADSLNRMTKNLMGMK